jgi:hypothetical protein
MAVLTYVICAAAGCRAASSSGARAVSIVLATRGVQLTTETTTYSFPPLSQEFTIVCAVTGVFEAAPTTLGVTSASLGDSPWATHN